MIYKFRVILDAEEDVFRDIAIESHQTLMDLHDAISNAFGFDGSELASFFTCDDNWNQGEEIPLMDAGDDLETLKQMSDFEISDLLHEEQTKIIYVYDFFAMWTFFVELAAIETAEIGQTYPALLFAHGILPAQAPQNDFDFDGGESEFDDFDSFDEDELDGFGDADGYGDMGFEENWN